MVGLMHGPLSLPWEPATSLHQPPPNSSNVAESYRAWEGGGKGGPRPPLLMACLQPAHQVYKPVGTALGSTSDTQQALGEA